MFPCRPGEKTPAVDHWKAWATADPDDILTGWPSGRCNIGISCGPSGLLVLDPDVKHGEDGPAALTAIMARDTRGGAWPATYTTETPSGGFHLYFRAPSGDHGNGRGALPRCIDVRGNGGYVVAAGSWIAEYGRSYTVGNGGHGCRVTDADTEVAPLPRRILEMISARPWRSVEPSQRRPMGKVKARKAKLGILRVILEAADGELNNTLHWGACRAGEMITTGDWDPDEAEEDLAMAARRANLEEWRIMPTILSGIKTGMES